MSTRMTRILLEASLAQTPRNHTAEIAAMLERRRRAQEAARFMAGLPTDEDAPDYDGLTWLRDKED